MPCLEWSSDEVEWEQGSGSKGPKSCRALGWISRRPLGAYFRHQITASGQWMWIWGLEGRFEVWRACIMRASLRCGGQIQSMEGWCEAWRAKIRPRRAYLKAEDCWFEADGGGAYRRTYGWKNGHLEIPPVFYRTSGSNQNLPINVAIGKVVA